ncbi:MAG: GNAT family N-acetyltransferase [Gaiellaceae bacterium]
MEIRRLREGDGARLRDVRLRALQDAPYAFSSWFGREADRDPEFWESRVAPSGQGESGVVFAAVEDERCLGMAGVYFAGEDSEAATLWGMWVVPSARRRGLAQELLEAVAAWARDSGARRLQLAVTDCESSRPAAALYRERGFVETGEREQLESDPSLVAVVMSRSL